MKMIKYSLILWGLDKEHTEVLIVINFIFNFNFIMRVNRQHPFDEIYENFLIKLKNRIQ